MNRGVLAVFCCLIACHTRADGGIGLGFLSSNIPQSQAFGVSNDGTVVVGRSNARAFRWTLTDGMTYLGNMPSGGYTEIAIGVSGDGAAIVGRGIGPDGDEAYRWTTNGILEFGTSLYRSTSEAWDASADGSVVVGMTRDARGGIHSNGTRAFHWTQPDGLVELGGGPESYARAVSDDGSIIVGVSNGTAFRWTEPSGMASIAMGLATAEAMSADGAFVVGQGFGGRGYIWSAIDGVLMLDSLNGAVQMIPQGVSGDGSVVVGIAANTASAYFEQFIWRRGIGVSNLQQTLINEYGLGMALAGWQFDMPNSSVRDMQARGISANGKVIVGYGLNPSGQIEAYAINIAAVPEPSGFLLVGISAVLVAIVMRRVA
jgi:uncharacterized membrane protein